MKIASAFAMAASSAQVANDPFSNLKPAGTNSDSYHMTPVHVVHARVQSDAPIWNAEGKRFVSRFGKELKSGYVAAVDTVNTASVEGALMYVQAEGININSRDKSKRCERKTNMQYIVFYEFLIAQTNETIAQFQDDWETNEYGPMIAMDGGSCTVTDGDKLPKECYQFNGEEGQPNLGPFIGGTSKEEDVRAPYPGNYWFSFPNTCPTKKWKDKTNECRNASRKGLCDLGTKPDGVTCTYTYNILGWVPIDDVVGITAFIDPKTKKPYSNFTEWCSASEDNIEFKGDDKTGEAEKSLEFWNNPKDKDANEKRAESVLKTYATQLESKKSVQVTEDDIKNMKPLPSVASLANSNPPCYKTVKSCGSGNGCKREGYSQLCVPCTEGEDCKTGDGNFKFPTLEKAKGTSKDGSSGAVQTTTALLSIAATAIVVALFT
jgi:hypothetical protein